MVDDENECTTRQNGWQKILRFWFQLVERCVQLVVQSAKNILGEEARDNMIANTLASRKTMNKFDSKQDYNVDKNISNHLKI